MSALLEIDELTVDFASRDGIVRAVDGVSYALDDGEALGVVGESGSGKSVTHLALLDLLPRGALVGARALRWRGADVREPAARSALRGREIALVFQDPTSALHPLLTIGAQLGEVVDLAGKVERTERRRRCADALAEVGIADPGARLDVYPHQMSGGMRQRVMIALALLQRPRLLVADEPTTALDVTIQAQVLDLFARIREKTGMALVLVTHSLGVVAGACDRVLVMYAGRVAETAGADELFARPMHPYTAGLFASVPRLDGDPRARLASIPGAPPAAGSASRACAFAPRCALADGRCTLERPALERVAVESSRRSACFHAREVVSLEAAT